MNEFIRTTGDVRRIIAQTMLDVRSGTIDASRAQAVAQLAKELNSSLQAEVNVAKTLLLLKDNGVTVGNVAQLGHLAVEDESTLVTVEGKANRE